MYVYAGIDEAGYGPMFGPLCVACTAFRVPGAINDGNGTPDLWKLLKRAVCRKAGDSRRRIAIDDSKKLKGSAGRQRHPLADLERGVLAVLAAGQDSQASLPGTCTELLSALGASSSDEHPWLNSERELPLSGEAALLRIDAARLGRTLEDCDIQSASMACTAVHAGAFNRGVRTLGNKAGVNLHCALRHVERLRRQHRESNLHVAIDRHGGRTHYRQPLQDFWPDAQLRVEGESDEASQYRLQCDGQVLRISFVRQGEAAHLPVALASMTAKYTRELLMLRLNAYFRQHLPELKPTAGYVQDGRRFLREIEPVIRRLNLPLAELVRQC